LYGVPAFRSRPGGVVVALLYFVWGHMYLESAVGMPGTKTFGNWNGSRFIKLRIGVTLFSSNEP